MVDFKRKLLTDFEFKSSQFGEDIKSNFKEYFLK